VVCGLAWPRCNNFHLLFSLYVNVFPTPPHNVELALYGNTAITATFRKPAPLISYLESYLNGLERWLRE
jgi:hypothetical protein